MTLQECTALLTPLALALRADMDDPTFRVYHRALQDVPAPLLEASINTLLREDRAFMPKAPEIRAAAERERWRLLAAHPYEGCIECEHSKGWTALLVDGVPRVTRCACYQRHQDKLARLGLSAQTLSLPPSREADYAAVGD